MVLAVALDHAIKPQLGLDGRSRFINKTCPRCGALVLPCSRQSIGRALIDTMLTKHCNRAIATTFLTSAPRKIAETSAMNRHGSRRVISQKLGWQVRRQTCVYLISRLELDHRAFECMRDFKPSIHAQRSGKRRIPAKNQMNRLAYIQHEKMHQKQFTIHRIPGLMKSALQNRSPGGGTGRLSKDLVVVTVKIYRNSATGITDHAFQC